MPEDCPLTTILADGELKRWFTVEVLGKDTYNVFNQDCFPIWEKMTESQRGDVMRLFLISKEAKKVANAILSVNPEIVININQSIAHALNLHSSLIDKIKEIVEEVYKSGI